MTKNYYFTNISKIQDVHFIIVQSVQSKCILTKIHPVYTLSFPLSDITLAGRNHNSGPHYEFCIT